MPKISATEKLAREICWQGFLTKPPHAGFSKRDEYWAHIHPNARTRYLEHAAELIWWTRKLGADRLAKAVEAHDAANTRS